ncbi:MAG: alpha/beta fold hydrolase [Segniliparus sp.]|uniref:alpha/beta fold hydrolase n=1 Tax=Segniliparus sp. TaxID=2804064 RepID=UPI003F3C7BDF
MINPTKRETIVVSADGTPIAAQEHGAPPQAAPALVLVHGYPNTHAVFSRLLPHLVEKYRVLTFDTRGSGNSGHPAAAQMYRLDKLDQDFAAVADALAPGEKIHYVGHDIGGVIGWDLLAHPQHAQRIATFTTFGAPSFDMFGTWFRKRIAVRDQPFGLLDIVNQMLRIPEFWGFLIPGVNKLAWQTGLFEAAVRWFNAMSGEPRETPYSPQDGHAQGKIYTANFGARVLRPRRSPLPSDIPVQSLDGLYDRFFSNSLQAAMDFSGAIVEHHPYRGGHWGFTTSEGAAEAARRIDRFVSQHVVLAQEEL